MANQIQTATYDITHYRGDAFVREFTFSTANVPDNLSGKTILAQCRNGTSMSSRLMFVFEIDRTREATGIIELTLPASTTRALSAGTYFWDMQIDDSTILSGEFKLLPDISRSVTGETPAVPNNIDTTVAGLPSAVGRMGMRFFVTDAANNTFLSVVAGGGENKVPVVSDGTNWLIG